MSSNIAGVTSAAGETGRMSNDVLRAASALSEQSSRLGQEVEAFIAKVRAG